MCITFWEPQGIRGGATHCSSSVNQPPTEGTRHPGSPYLCPLLGPLGQDLALFMDEEASGLGREGMLGGSHRNHSLVESGSVCNGTWANFRSGPSRDKWPSNPLANTHTHTHKHSTYLKVQI